jgi:hypothetical protein
MFPVFIFFFCIPDYLRVWTKKGVFAPAFQFFALAAIYDFIFFPVIC